MNRISFIISLFILSLNLLAETHHLKVPDLSDENILAYNAGIRPYRTSGMRIEIEELHGKSIIHNYGHGGAGISLSWGSAQEAIGLMYAHYAPKAGSTIAIMGAGVMGLSVANQLLDQGYNVKIYAKDFEDTTSVVAAGLWEPFGIAIPENGPAKDQFERVKQVSHAYFHDLAISTSPRYKGVSYKSSYSFASQDEPMKTKPGWQIVDVLFENGIRKVARTKELMLIETPTYMRELSRNALDRGAVFVTYQFESSSHVAAIQEDIIFNCLGFGSREIFGDTDLVPIRGQLVYVKPTLGVDYFASAPDKNIGDVFLFTFPYKDKYILGGSYEKHEDHRVTTAEIRIKILENARRLFSSSPAKIDEL